MASPYGAPKKDNTFNVAIVGDATVGKTSLLLRWIDGTFEDGQPIMSIGEVDYKAKSVMVDGTEVTLRVWDTAGAERYKGVTKSTFRRASAVVVAYSVNDERSYQHVTPWLKDVENATEQKLLVVLAACKTDIENAAMNSEHAQKASAELGHRIFETSSKSNTNVEELFTHLAEELLKSKKDQQKDEPPVTATVKLESDGKVKSPKKKSGCALF